MCSDAEFPEMADEKKAADLAERCFMKARTVIRPDWGNQAASTATGMRIR